MMRRFLAALSFAILTALAAASFAQPAQAELKVCNRTSYILGVAVGYHTPSIMITQGWTRLVPGSCAVAVSGHYNPPTYYVYARTSRAHSGPPRAWAGSTNLCAKDANFFLKSPMGVGCQNDGEFTLPFAEVHTHGRHEWATTFTEDNAIASFDAARNAGLARLLNDNGFKAGPVDGSTGKSFTDALAAFREQAHLPGNASYDALYSALQTEGLKKVAPAGYTICNDTAAPALAAIATPAGKDWDTRGWWKLAPGLCANAITTPLHFDKVYLRADTPDGKPLVQGPEKFCVTTIEFEISGRGQCAKHGLSEVGFYASNTKGRTGFVAHIAAQPRKSSARKAPPAKVPPPKRPHAATPK